MSLTKSGTLVRPKLTHIFWVQPNLGPYFWVQMDQGGHQDPKMSPIGSD